jgi:hypothetical protein
VTSPAPPPVVDEPDEAAFDPDREPLPALKSSGFAQFGSVMGGVIAGIEQQVFGRKPPGEIQDRQAQPTRGLTGDGTEVTLDFPERGHGERDDGDRGGTDRPT